MVARFTLCDSGKLQLAIAGELPEPALGELSRHLQSCPHCRGELEVLSGGEGWLGEARQYLSSSDELVAVQEMTPPAGVASLLSSGRGPARPGFVPFPSGDDDPPAIDLDFLAPSDDPAKLGTLGNYEIESVIGRGGFGIVLKAFDRALNRYVAIKALSGTLVRSSAARKRFDREAKAAAAVVHDHVIPIHHIETAGPVPYLVMPFVTGPSLQERIDECGPLGTIEVLRIAMQTAQGLDAAHAQGLVHRDIKPANILLENGVERVRITDFGLARAVDDASQTQSGYIAGTPQYMAPEQARGESVDSRADLFSLGSVMYAMCSGHPPFRADTTLAVLRRICDDEPRCIREINPEVPAWMATIIDRLLSKSRDHRFQSAGEVAQLLEGWLAHVQQPLRIPPPVSVVAETKAKPTKVRHSRLGRIGGTLAALAAGMLVVGGLYAWLPGLIVQRAPQGGAGSTPIHASPSPVSKTRTAVPAPVTLDAAISDVRDDLTAARSIDVELFLARQDLDALESAGKPAVPEGSSVGDRLGELSEALDRLEREMNEQPRLHADEEPVIPDSDS